MRTQRARLQQALLKAAPEERIHLEKRLGQVDLLPSGQVRLTFEDGFSTDVDLVIGADGIRSVCIEFPQPEIVRLSSPGGRSYVAPPSRLTQLPTPDEWVTGASSPYRW